MKTYCKKIFDQVDWHEIMSSKSYIVSLEICFGRFIKIRTQRKQ